MSPPGQKLTAQRQQRENLATSVQESLVRGVVSAAKLADVQTLIRLLCPEVGHLGPFRDYERVYNTSPDIRGPKHCVRLREHLLRPESTPRPADWVRYELVHYGIMDRRVLAPVERRPVQVVAVGKEAPKLMSVMGCVFVHEYVKTGERFRTMSGLTVECYVLEKLQKPGDVESAIGEGDLAVVEVRSDIGASAEDILGFIACLAHLGVVIREGK